MELALKREELPTTTRIRVFTRLPWIYLSPHCTGLLLLAHRPGVAFPLHLTGAMEQDFENFPPPLDDFGWDTSTLAFDGITDFSEQDAPAPMPSLTEPELGEEAATIGLPQKLPGYRSASFGTRLEMGLNPNPVDYWSDPLPGNKFQTMVPGDRGLSHQKLESDSIYSLPQGLEVDRPGSHSPKGPLYKFLSENGTPYEPSLEFTHWNDPFPEDEFHTTTREGRGLSHSNSNSSLGSAYSRFGEGTPGRGLRLTGAYECQQCSTTFDVPSNLRHHERKHIPKEHLPHACSVFGCRERFLFPKDLRRHAKRKHSQLVSIDHQPTQPSQALNSGGKNPPGENSTDNRRHLDGLSKENLRLRQRLQTVEQDIAFWFEEYHTVLTALNQACGNGGLPSKVLDGISTELSFTNRAELWLGSIRSRVCISKRAAGEDYEPTAKALEQLMKDVEDLKLG